MSKMAVVGLERLNRLSSDYPKAAFLLENRMRDKLGRFIKGHKSIGGFQKGHKGFRKKIRIKSNCLYCGKMIFVKPYLLKIGSGKFCNMRCYAKWQSKNRRLEKSFSWKGGNEATYRKLARTIIKNLSIPLICAVCKRKKSIIIHHIDENIKNNIIFNLRILCQSCHVNLHNKIERRTKQDLAKHFICHICHKEFTVNTNKERKVCSSICSYEYSKRGLHWRQRAR